MGTGPNPNGDPKPKPAVGATGPLQPKYFPARTDRPLTWYPLTQDDRKYLKVLRITQDLTPA